MLLAPYSEISALAEPLMCVVCSARLWPPKSDVVSDAEPSRLPPGRPAVPPCRKMEFWPKMLIRSPEAATMLPPCTPLSLSPMDAPSMSEEAA